MSRPSRPKPIGRLIPAKGAPSFDLAALIDALPDVKRLDATQWSYDTDDGRHVRLGVRGSEVVFSGVFDPTRFSDGEHPGWIDDEHANAPLFEAVERLAQPLQSTTRASLELGDGDEVIADETCPRCEKKCFHFETVCPSCGDDLGDTPRRADEDDDDRWAKRLLDELLAKDQIDIDLRRRASVESVLATHLANFGPHVREVARALEDHPAIEEVYADDEALAQALQRSKPRGR